MSSASASFDVQQKKNPDEAVKWNEYEPIFTDFQNLEVKVDEATRTAQTT